MADEDVLGPDEMDNVLNCRFGELLVKPHNCRFIIKGNGGNRHTAINTYVLKVK